jgi:hypothetical protein
LTPEEKIKEDETRRTLILVGIVCDEVVPAPMSDSQTEYGPLSSRSNDEIRRKWIYQFVLFDREPQSPLTLTMGLAPPGHLLLCLRVCNFRAIPAYQLQNKNYESQIDYKKGTTASVATRTTTTKPNKKSNHREQYPKAGKWQDL